MEYRGDVLYYGLMVFCGDMSSSCVFCFAVLGDFACWCLFCCMVLLSCRLFCQVLHHYAYYFVRFKSIMHSEDFATLYSIRD